MGLFDRSNKEYAKIHIEFDIDKKGEGTVEVEGDEVSLAAAVGVLIHHMLRKGFNRKILEFSILKALKDNEKKEKTIFTYTRYIFQKITKKNLLKY